MKKRVAILTLPPVSNYGCILQNFALQQTLNNLGVKSVTLYRRYRTPIKQQLKLLIYEVYNILRGKKLIKFTSKQKDYIHKEPILFKKKYLNLTEPIYSTQALKSKVQTLNIDSIIVGSDQVWRPKYTSFIYNYYLDFIEKDFNIKKIAYAASFGVDSWEYSEVQTRRCMKLAKEFASISVRENSGINLSKQFLRVVATQVLDPTLLLTKEDYLSLIDYTQVPKREGIFTYLLDDNIEKRKLVNYIEDSLKLKEFKNQPMALRENDSLSIQDYVIPSIEGWIKGFDQAEFIVTDSFHGTAFSILFNKPFIAIANKSRGLTRFTSLLNLFKLEDRLVYSTESFKLEHLEDIDWGAINSILNEEKEKSIQFIKDSLYI